MNSTFAVVDLLGQIVALAQDVLCRPAGDRADRRARCEELDLKLEAAIASAGGAGARFLDNFAPMLLQAIERALLKRQYGDEQGAAQWESLVGSLMPQVRADSARALDWLAEISRTEKVAR
jgi:hypothetical protein